MRQPSPSPSSRASRKHARFTVPLISALSVCALLATGPIAFGFPTQSRTNDGSPVGQQASEAGAKLVQATKAVALAQRALDSATERQPVVQDQLDAARNAVKAAKRAQVQAAARVEQAQAAVDRQNIKLATSEDRIKQTRARVGRIARQAYISGAAAPLELEILLQSRDPESFELQLQALSRRARSNGDALGDLARAQQEQNVQLAAMRAVQGTADRAKSDVEKQAQDAEAASQAAADAQTELASLVSQRKSTVAAVAQKRMQVATLYNELLTQQQAELEAAAREQAAADAAAKREAAKREAAKKRRPANKPAAGKPPTNEPARGPSTPPRPRPKPSGPPVSHGVGGYVSTIGTNRGAKRAIAWALSMVGSGYDYHNQCLRFVDDAYDVSGGRTWTAIAQYERARDAGYAHPGDRHPPIGAEVFWETSNPARHIALYAGGGMVISTDAADGAVGFVPMSTLDQWGPYLGWARPYYP